ncbi:MAG: hypothetical protein AB1714_30845 [Acidobacteriota bacterium]
MRDHGGCWLAAGLVVALASSRWPAAGQPSARADQIVALCAKAMGGMETIRALRTLRIGIVYPDHGAAPIFCEIRRPNKIRTRITVFDGTRGCLLKDPTGQTGASFRPRLIPDDELKDFEVDIAWFIPAFFDYPYEHLGSEVAGGTEMHKLAVSLPLGAKMTYYVDGDAFLVRRAASDIVVGGNDYHMERAFSDFEPAGGILFPRSFVYPGRQDGTQTATVASIEVNIPLSDDDFRIPVDVQE